MRTESEYIRRGMRVSTAARQLGISSSALHQAILEERLTARRVTVGDNSILMVLPEDLDDYAQRKHRLQYYKKRFEKTQRPETEEESRKELVAV